MDKKREVKEILNKGVSTPMGILIIFVVAVTVGVSAWYLGKNQVPETSPKPSPSATPSSTSLKPDETADWKTYKNQKHSFTFNYPDFLDFNPFTKGPLYPLGPEDGGILVNRVNFSPEEGLYPSIIFSPLIIDTEEEGLEDYSDEDIILKKASLFNDCYEDIPMEPVIETRTDFTKIEVYYFVAKGCQGTSERHLNSNKDIFFLRDDINKTIHFANSEIDEELFDKIISTFKFIE